MTDEAKPLQQLSDAQLAEAAGGIVTGEAFYGETEPFNPNYTPPPRPEPLPASTYQVIMEPIR